MKLRSTAIALGVGAVAGAALTVAGTILLSARNSAVTLYSDSPLIENERVHVATFDAYNDLEYNLGNCEISADLRMESATSNIKYWCEEGYFRK